DRAEPRVGSSVEAPPSLQLHFTEPIEPAFCRLEVMDPAGKRVDTSPPEHPPADALRVTLPPLAPGGDTGRPAVVSVETPSPGRRPGPCAPGGRGGEGGLRAPPPRSRAGSSTGAWSPSPRRQAPGRSVSLPEVSCSSSSRSSP